MYIRGVSCCGNKVEVIFPDKYNQTTLGLCPYCDELLLFFDAPFQLFGNLGAWCLVASSYNGRENNKLIFENAKKFDLALELKKHV